MNINLLGRILFIGTVAVFAACQPAEPADGAAPATAEAPAAEAPAAEASAAEAPAAEGSTAAAAPAAEGSAAAAPAAEGMVAAAPTAEGTEAAAPAADGAVAEAPAVEAAPAADASPGEPVAVATAELLHGTWRVDMAAALAAQEANMSPEERAMMQALMGSMQINFTFNADGTAIMSASGMGQQEVKSGTWAAGAVNGTAITFTLTENGEDGTPGEPQTFTATFTDSKNITLSKEGEAETMPLVRVN